MGARIRLGPVSVTSKGRVGVKAGPVSVYAGGRRRRRRQSDGGGGGGLVAFIAIALLIALIVKFWYIALAVVIVMGSVAVLTSRRSARQAKERARAQAAAIEAEAAETAERHAMEEQTRLEAQRRWLAGPPPPLVLPGRFTENWFASHVPSMHPGQVPVGGAS